MSTRLTREYLTILLLAFLSSVTWGATTACIYYHVGNPVFVNTALVLSSIGLALTFPFLIVVPTAFSED